MAKDIGLIIDFDDVEYSNKERDLLWGRFIMALVEASENQKKENKSAKCIKFPKPKTTTENRKKVHTFCRGV